MYLYTLKINYDYMEQKVYSKDMPLTFPVIKQNKRKITFSQGIMVVIAGFLLLYIIIYKTYYRDDIVASVRSAILFVLLIIAVFIVNYLMQKFKFGGECTITDKELILNTTNKSAKFPINEISNLKMVCSTTGKNAKTLSSITRWLFGKSDGCGNSVQFTYKEQDYNMELYINGKEEAEMFLQRAKELM